MKLGCSSSKTLATILKFTILRRVFFVTVYPINLEERRKRCRQKSEI